MRMVEADKLRIRVEGFLQEAKISMWTIQLDIEGHE